MTTSDQSSVQSQVSPSCDSRLVGLDAVIPSPILTVIGVAASPLFALWTVVIVGVLVGGTAGLAGGGLVWLIAMVYLVTRSSIFGTIRGLCYAVAVLLLLTPSIVLTDAAKGGTFGGQLILFGVSEFVFGCIALGLIGIGYRLGRYRPSVRSVDG